MKQNKFYRFLVFDSRSQIRIVLCALLLVFMAWQQRLIKIKDKELKQVKSEQDMVSRIAEMQAALRGKTVKKAVMPPPTVEFHLQGISQKKGIYYALIDEEIHMEGDTLRDYTVTKITRNFVTLENQTTKAIKHLYLPE